MPGVGEVAVDEAAQVVPEPRVGVELQAVGDLVEDDRAADVDGEVALPLAELEHVGTDDQQLRRRPGRRSGSTNWPSTLRRQQPEQGADLGAEHAGGDHPVAADLLAQGREGAAEAGTG